MIIRIKNLRADTILGVYDWEKEKKRPVILNIEMDIADDMAADSDNIKDAVDYAMIEQRVFERLEAASYNLIEKLAADTARFIISLDKRIAKVTVEADKPGALTKADSVSVTFTC